MDEFEISVLGLDDVSALLGAAPKQIVKAAFARALAAAAALVASELDARTPKHTGDLRAHLVTDIAIDAEGRGGTAQVGFGKEGWKARLVETGHRMIGHQPDKKDLGVVAPHPFMGPAAIASADEATEAFAETLSESLQGDILKNAS